MMILRNIRSLSLTNFKRTKYTLPDLPYDYNALEPVISAEIMEIHHKKHHSAYISNLNDALDSFEDARIKNDLVKQNLCPIKDAHGKPSGPLADAIQSSFGSFEAFKTHFNAQTAIVQGSGWGWLGFNPISGKVQFATTNNQDLLQATHGLIPLLGVDVWEHAYYLQYKNVRPDYLKSIWDIINWDDVSQRFHEALAIKK